MSIQYLFLEKDNTKHIYKTTDIIYNNITYLFLKYDMKQHIINTNILCKKTNDPPYTPYFYHQ